MLPRTPLGPVSRGGLLLGGIYAALRTAHFPRAPAPLARPSAPRSWAAALCATLSVVPDFSTTVRASARPRPGRRFQPIAELALEEDALRAASMLPGAARGLLVIREVAGPFGVPDWIAVVGPPDLIQRRLAHDVPPLLNEVDAGIVGATAPVAPRSLAHLAAQLGWPVPTIERRIPGLVRSGALIEHSAGRFTRLADLVPIGRIYAIETKLRNWRRAVQQGRMYRLWCDSYVVVMASLGSAPVEDLLSSAGEDNAGVMVGGRWLARPKIHDRPISQRLWGSEHIVAALDAT